MPVCLQTVLIEKDGASTTFAKDFCIGVSIGQVDEFDQVVVPDIFQVEGCRPLGNRLHWHTWVRFYALCHEFGMRFHGKSREESHKGDTTALWKELETSSKVSALTDLAAEGASQIGNRCRNTA